MKSRLFRFKVGQFLWVALVSFSAYYFVFDVEAFKAPATAIGVVSVFLTPRYMFLSSLVDWDKWERKDIDRLIYIPRELAITAGIFLLVYYFPSWWFTKDYYEVFGDPVFFEFKNYEETDFFTARHLHKNYGMVVALLIVVLDNWTVFVQSRKIPANML